MIINNGYFFFDEETSYYLLGTLDKWCIQLHPGPGVTLSTMLITLSFVFPLLDFYTKGSKLKLLDRVNHFKIRDIRPQFLWDTNPSGVLRVRSKELLKQYGMSPEGVEHKFGNTTIVYDFTGLTRDFLKSGKFTMSSNYKTMILPLMSIVSMDPLTSKVKTNYYKTTYNDKKICIAIPRLKTNDHT